MHQNKANLKALEQYLAHFPSNNTFLSSDNHYHVQDGMLGLLIKLPPDMLHSPFYKWEEDPTLSGDINMLVKELHCPDNHLTAQVHRSWDRDNVVITMQLNDDPAIADKLNELVEKRKAWLNEPNVLFYPLSPDHLKLEGAVEQYQQQQATHKVRQDAENQRYIHQVLSKVQAEIGAIVDRLSPQDKQAFMHEIETSLGISHPEARSPVKLRAGRSVHDE